MEFLNNEFIVQALVVYAITIQYYFRSINYEQEPTTAYYEYYKYIEFFFGTNKLTFLMSFQFVKRSDG